MSDIQTELEQLRAESAARKKAEKKFEGFFIGVGKSFYVFLILAVIVDGVVGWGLQLVFHHQTIGKVIFLMLGAVLSIMSPVWYAKEKRDELDQYAHKSFIWSSIIFGLINMWLISLMTL